MDPQELAKKIGAGLLSFPVTHFTPDGAFNEQSYRQHLSWLLSYNPAGLFAAGGTGEFFSLTLDEFSAVVKAAVEETAGQRPRPRRLRIRHRHGHPVRPGRRSRRSRRPPAPPALPRQLRRRQASSPTSKPSANPPNSASSSTTATTPSSTTARPRPASATRCPNLIGFKDGVGDLELMTRIYARLGDRLTYVGGLPTAETFALPYLEMGVTTYSSAIFNFLPNFAHGLLRRRPPPRPRRRLRQSLRDFVLPYIAIRDRRKGYAVSIVKAGMTASVGHDCGPVRTPLIDLTPDELASLKSLIGAGAHGRRPRNPALASAARHARPLRHRRDALHRQLLQLRRPRRPLHRRHLLAEATSISTPSLRLPALRLQLGLRLRAASLRLAARPLRHQARLRHQHPHLVRLAASSDSPDTSPAPQPSPPSSSSACSPASPSPPSSPATAASSPHGSPPPSAAPPPQSSTPRNTSRWSSSPRSSAGSPTTTAGKPASGSSASSACRFVFAGTRSSTTSKPTPASTPAEIDHHRERRRPLRHRLRRRHRPQASPGRPSPASSAAHARRNLHRPVLHQHPHLVLHHLVPAIPRQARHMSVAQGRIRRRTSRPLRLHRRRPRRHLAPTPSSAPAARSPSPAKPPSSSAWPSPCTMMLCNVVDTQWQILLLMSIAFFGKGFGALGWTVVSDTSPTRPGRPQRRRLQPLRQHRRHHHPHRHRLPRAAHRLLQLALIFVGVTALLAIASYVFIVGPIRRLNPEEVGAPPASI